MISENDIQHGRPWRGENVAGWLASEKLDGCRGYWDGARMWSRSGRQIPIPAVWAKKLPAMHLDGEIWAGRGKWEVTVDAVARGKWEIAVCFIVFDAPQVQGPWTKRLAAAAKRLRGNFAATVPYQVIEGIEHAARIFREIRLAGGEGLVLRHPEAPYRACRSPHVLKLKRCPLTGELEWQERRRAA